MKIKKAYKDINETLSCIRLQVRDGMEWAARNCPTFNNSAELYYYLMDRVKYKHDPPDTELLHWYSVNGAQFLEQTRRGGLRLFRDRLANFVEL